MSAVTRTGEGDVFESATSGLTELPFPPITKQHILNCSYHSWHPKFRAITPKARLIPLPPAFIEYLRTDGIVLPPEDGDHATWSDDDSGIFSGADNNDEDDEAATDPSATWRDTHEAVERTIEELGGKVAPKLNWSAPKDATFMSATNSMECRTPNDIYLLLKSSNFITHDLEQVFDDTSDHNTPAPDIPYHLVLRKWITLNPSVEFRCFVRDRRLIALCQRDVNHFDFLFDLQDKLRDRIQDLFDSKLRDAFPDPNFTFDVYVPPPHDKVWVVDFNPWAIRTDPLVFSWMELLTMDVPKSPSPPEETTVRLMIAPKDGSTQSLTNPEESLANEESDSGSDVEEIWQPEFRLIKRDDPEAYSFASAQYSAHKLPKDIVDAGSGGPGAMQDLLQQVQTAYQQQSAQDSEDD